MVTRVSQLQRFFHSHHFFGGLRQAIGVMLPTLLAGGLWQVYDIGMIASIGAACVAVIDQPGSPRRYSVNTMMGAVLLGTLTVAVTGLVSSHPLALWLTIPLLGFAFSMLTVYGPQGGLMAFACLLIMTLTMRAPISGQQLLLHVMYSLAGGLFYFVYSSVVRRVFWLREVQQALSVALFATADYIATRSRFYDVHADLDTSYRDLIRAQSDMIDKQQAARNTVLRELPKGKRRGDRQRMKALNLFIDMVSLMDTLIATHTDYATLHRRLADSDVLVFARDTLVKLSDNVQQIALCTARNQAVVGRHSAKAELRAIEYELEQYRESGFAKTNPEVYALLVQVLRRLRNGARIVDRMVAHTQRDAGAELVDQRLDKALGRFISRTELRLGMITSNLRMDSPHFRYALRVAIAILVTMFTVALLNYGLARQHVAPPIELHVYWVILTVIVIMKPGFALTRQRNGLRLAGTIIGCLASFGLFMLTDRFDLLLAALIVTCILGYSLIQVSFMGTAIFKTIMVLLAFHLLAPTSNALIGERLIDTIIGCAIALLCSHILPWWEHNFMASLAKALRTANHRYLQAGLHYAQLARPRDGGASGAGDAEQDAALLEADMAWRLARKNVYIAFSNYAAAFYRMAAEPARRQKNVPELNNLLAQSHILTSQISAAVPLLAALPSVPPGINQALEAVDALLQNQDAELPASLETEGELATLAYPLRQMMNAAQLIRHELLALEPPRAHDDESDGVASGRLGLRAGL